MNKQNAAQYLPLVQAWAEGKEIQVNPLGKRWLDVGNDNLDLMKEPSFYRIKPECKIITAFVNIYNDKFYSFYFTKDGANKASSFNRIACVPVTITYEEGEGI